MGRETINQREDLAVSQKFDIVCQGFPGSNTMRNGEPNIYAALATLRNGYMQMQWGRVQMFLVFNMIAFPLVFGEGQLDRVKLIISIVGASGHLFLLQATLRADGWIKFLDARMRELERLDEGDPNSSRVPVFNHRTFSSIRGSWFASRRAFAIGGIIVGGIWVWQTFRYALINLG